MKLFSRKLFSRAGPVSAALPTARFDRTAGVLCTSQGDTTVVLDVRGGTYFTLNEVGGRIWQLLGEGTTVGGVVERLAAEYDVPLERLAADVNELIDRLLATRLIAAAGP
jgi:hypothetical protein